MKFVKLIVTVMIIISAAAFIHTYANAGASDVIQNIEDYLGDKSGLYSIRYFDLTGNDGFGINDNEEVYAASTIKVPINMYFWDEVSKGGIDPDIEMEYIESYYEGGTGIIQSQPVGTKYSLRELSRLSIEYSDNIATNMLIGALGWENILAYRQSMIDYKEIPAENYSTAFDMSIYLENLWKNSQTSGNWNELLTYMENTIFNDRINSMLPDNVLVAHKIGNWETARNDVGIVFSDKPYILCIMSKDTSDASDMTMGEISKMVYDYSSTRE